MGIYTRCTCEACRPKGIEYLTPAQHAAREEAQKPYLAAKAADEANNQN
jgi:hypothetical protein